MKWNDPDNQDIRDSGLATINYSAMIRCRRWDWDAVKVRGSIMEPTKRRRFDREPLLLPIYRIACELWAFTLGQGPSAFSASIELLLIPQSYYEDIQRRRGRPKFISYSTPSPRILFLFLLSFGDSSGFCCQNVFCTNSAVFLFMS